MPTRNKDYRLPVTDYYSDTTSIDAKDQRMQWDHAYFLKHQMTFSSFVAFKLMTISQHFQAMSSTIVLQVTVSNSEDNSTLPRLRALNFE